MFSFFLGDKVCAFLQKSFLGFIMVQNRNMLREKHNKYD